MKTVKSYIFKVSNFQLMSSCDLSLPTVFVFQRSRVMDQNEAVSAKNGSLQTENESLRSDLDLLRSDYEIMQEDMNEAKEHYNDLDISATKIAHRCEVGIAYTVSILL